MINAIKIYIADDHQIIIDGISLLLKNEVGLQIIGSTTSGNRAFDNILNLKPDIAIVDLRMPEKDGIEILRGLKGKIKTKIIILSMHIEKRYIIDAMNYGAYGYMFKNIGQQELIETIYTVIKGEKCFPRLESKKTDRKDSILTPREIDILSLILKEYSSIQISKKLFLSLYTVDTHRKNILRKTGAKNIIGLVKYAMEHNISLDGL